jgi:hypothetical protein
MGGVAGFYATVSLLISIMIVVFGVLGVILFQLPVPAWKFLILFLLVFASLIWTLFRGLLAFPSRVDPGLSIKSLDHPRLFDLLTDVGQRLEADPLQEVKLVPGATVRLHQEGRGPFGIMGVRRRVLILGWSAVRLLDRSELQVLVTRAYVSSSRRSTFAGRFLSRALQSIRESLDEIRNLPGRRFALKPFFWLLAGYHAALNLLASPYLRSREFLADRLAACLGGADVLGSALTRVSIEAALLEMALFEGAARKRRQGILPESGGNLFLEIPRQNLSDPERHELLAKLQGENSPLSARVPAFRDRVEELASLPSTQDTNTVPAGSLFEDPEDIEVRLTVFLMNSWTPPAAVKKGIPDLSRKKSPVGRGKEKAPARYS